MNISKLFACVAAVLLFAGQIAFAQYEVENNGWMLSGAAGFNTSYKNLNHGYGTALDLGIGKWLSPAFGLRAGWNGLYSGLDEGQTYNQKTFNFFHGDLLWDLTSSCWGSRPERVSSLIPYANLGYLDLGKRDIAPREGIYGADVAYKGMAVGGGLMLPVRLSSCLNIVPELRLMTPVMGDGKGYLNGAALVGLMFNFGKPKRAIQEPPVVMPAPVPAPKPQPAPEPEVVEPQPEPEIVVVPAFESLQRNILFVIDTWDISDSEQLKIDEVVAVMKEYPETRVRISGYADKETGTAQRNLFLSRKRAETVAAAIMDAGISKDRIVTEYFGDTVNPYDVPEQNRVAVCFVK